jgi:hypothetical protein
VPWVAPNPDPLIVTTSPPFAAAGDTEATTAPPMGDVAVPIEKMCSCPCVAPFGRVTPASVLLASTGSAAEKMWVAVLSRPPLQPAQLRYGVLIASTLPYDGCDRLALSVQSDKPSQNWDVLPSE